VTVPGVSRAGRWNPGTPLVAMLLTAGFMVTVQLVTHPPGLLLERVLPGGGWVMLPGLAIYAGWLTGRLADPRQAGAGFKLARSIFLVLVVLLHATFLGVARI
jgi:ferredoxin-type protein NapH